MAHATTNILYVTKSFDPDPRQRSADALLRELAKQFKAADLNRGVIRVETIPHEDQFLPLTTFAVVHSNVLGGGRTVLGNYPLLATAERVALTHARRMGCLYAPPPERAFTSAM